jgi:hypothetical protein
MHWKLAEYFEAVLIQGGNPQTKLLVRQLRQEVTDHIQAEPTVFARQLPLLFSHIQTLLKLNTRQAAEVDSYSALLHAIHIVSTTGQLIFNHTQAFETFVEIFLYSLAVSLFEFVNLVKSMFSGSFQSFTTMGINFGPTYKLDAFLFKLESKASNDFS